MSKLARPVICAQCADAKAQWNDDCPHAIELWRDGYGSALLQTGRPRLTSEDVRRALEGLSLDWENFYHLAADSLNRVLDQKDKLK